MNDLESTINNRAGQFDTSFGIERNGTVYIGTENIQGASKLLPTDGAFITLGQLRNQPGYILGAVKHRTNGFFDETFGVVQTDLGFEALIHEFIVQPDGKSVALGGYSKDGSRIEHAFIARFKQDGHLDETFAQGGLKQLDNTIQGAYNNNHGLVLQADGKIVAAFSHSFVSSSAIVRLDSAGQFDDEFGQGGVITLQDVLLQSLTVHDKGLVTGGRIGNKAVLMRYLDNGNIDTAFGDAGTVEFDLTFEMGACVNSLGSDAHGRIVVAGGNRYLPPDYNFVTRLLPDGKQDGGFNQGSPLVTRVAQGATTALAIQPDGKTLILLREPGRGSRVYVARYNERGELDETFGNAGHALAFIDPQSRPLTSDVDKLELQKDGKIVVSGFFFGGSYIGRLLGN